MNLYETLENLNINYSMIEHEALFTVEEAKKIEDRIEGIGCKNLFLTDQCEHFYLVVLQEDKIADIKFISNLVGAKHLTFAKETELNNILGLSKGSVTPLGIINDDDNKVIVLVDKELQNNKILCHPNVNTKTISIEIDDLIKFINFFNHKYIIF